MEKKQIIVICTGNSCRSQMAEGFFRHYGNENLEIFSAGTHPSYVHPLAISVMQEKGIDISSHHSDSVQKYVDQPFDFVITVCDSAREKCPVFTNGKEKHHWGFDDPTANMNSDSTGYEGFRKVRDKIGQTIYDFLEHNGWLKETKGITHHSD